MEAEEKVQSQEAHLKLEIKKLEVEADRAVWLRQLELVEGRHTAVSGGSTAPSTAAFDIGKHIVFLPWFTAINQVNR